MDFILTRHNPCRIRSALGEPYSGSSETRRRHIGEMAKAFAAGEIRSWLGVRIKISGAKSQSGLEQLYESVAVSRRSLFPELGNRRSVTSVDLAIGWFAIYHKPWRADVEAEWSCASCVDYAIPLQNKSYAPLRLRRTPERTPFFSKIGGLEILRKFFWPAVCRTVSRYLTIRLMSR